MKSALWLRVALCLCASVFECTLSAFREPLDATASNSYSYEKYSTITTRTEKKAIYELYLIL